MKTTAGAHDGIDTATTGGRRRRLGCLLALALLSSSLLAMSPAIASATTLEMRGEWELLLTRGSEHVKAIAVISQEANGSGEFASSSLLVENTIPGSFTGTLLSATQASVRLTTQPYGPVAAGEFTSSSMTVSAGPGNPTISGSGTLTNGGTSSSAELTATRIRTYKEIEEQHEREQREAEEAQLREDVRGEWSLTLKAGSQTAQGIARIMQAASPANEFSAAGTLFEGGVAGTFSGKLALEAGKTSVTITTEAAGPVPASRFTSSTITVESTAGALSMSGSGTVEAGGTSFPATLTATRTKTYKQLRELEAQQALEREAKEREEREAREAREKLEREAREQREREAREAQEKLAREEAAKLSAVPASQTFSGAGNLSKTIAVEPLSKALAMNAAGSLALPLSNPNAFAVTGRVTLALVSGHAGKAAAIGRRASSKARHAKKAPPILGASSFSIAAHRRTTIEIALSKAGRTELARHKTLAVVLKVITRASGKTSVSKTYRITLRAAAPGGHRTRR